MFDDFRRVMSQFDCVDNYSTAWKCNDCEKAYKDWLCAIMLPYYNESTPLVIRPCPVYSLLVENHCPYMSPHAKHQYAGEPLFASPHYCDALDDTCRSSTDYVTTSSSAAAATSSSSAAGAAVAAPPPSSPYSCFYPCNLSTLDVSDLQINNNNNNNNNAETTSSTEAASAPSAAICIAQTGNGDGDDVISYGNYNTVAASSSAARSLLRAAGGRQCWPLPCPWISAVLPAVVLVIVVVTAPAAEYFRSPSIAAIVTVAFLLVVSSTT
jgi:hypothetical protein